MNTFIIKLEDFEGNIDIYPTATSIIIDNNTIEIKDGDEIYNLSILEFNKINIKIKHEAYTNFGF